ncbi:MAG: hypothetical protein HLUCCA12_15990 [Rhodobacteraceae bacterium HLUCCA12]|nr:MAG: hypothetical protein HLUCCA12_15990 [Rhodobacteraceae bacterium HLUCCA12]
MRADPTMIAGVSRDRIAEFHVREARQFVRARRASQAWADGGAGDWLGGVPMHWMADWPSPFAPVVSPAARKRQIDRLIAAFDAVVGALCKDAPDE